MESSSPSPPFGAPLSSSGTSSHSAYIAINSSSGRQQDAATRASISRPGSRSGMAATTTKTATMSRTSSFSAMFRIKHSDSHLSVPQLSKCLTFWDLIPLGVGSTIGAGVYVLIGTIAREKAGPALPLSFLIAGLAAAMSALCYAELASRCPSAGSAYHYAYTTVGEFVAWIIGWALILEYSVGGAAVARGISPNLAVLFGGADNVPFLLARLPVPGTDIILDPCAAIAVASITLLLCTGIKESASFQLFMTVANVLVLSTVVVAGTFVGCTTGWPGYQSSSSFLPFGVTGLLGGAGMAFYSYIGFDVVATTAEEVKKPQRDLPLGIGLSLLICTSLYIAVSIVLVGITPFAEIDRDTPISKTFSDHHMQWAAFLVSLGALAALATTLLGSLLPQPRILMVMGRDGLLPPWFCHVSSPTSTATSSSSSAQLCHQSHHGHASKSAGGVPLNSTILTGLFAASLAFFMELDELSDMVSVGTLLAFTIVSISVLVLRFAPPIPSPSSSHPSLSSLPSASSLKSNALLIPPPTSSSSSNLLWAAKRPPQDHSSSLGASSSSLFNRLGSPESIGVSPVVAILSDDQLASLWVVRKDKKVGKEKLEREGKIEEADDAAEELPEKMDGVDSLRSGSKFFEGGDGGEKRAEEESEDDEEEEEEEEEDEELGEGKRVVTSEKGRGGVWRESNNNCEDLERELLLKHQAANQKLLPAEWQGHGEGNGRFLHPEKNEVDNEEEEGEKEEAGWMSRDGGLTRRDLASFSISCIVFSSPLLSLAPAAAPHLPFSLWLLLVALAALLFIGSFAILLFVREDERRHQFGASGGFQCPFVPTLPVASILVNIYLMVNLGVGTWLRCSVWLTLGVLIYFSYGINHSTLGGTEGPRILNPRKRSKSWWALPAIESPWRGLLDKY